MGYEIISDDPSELLTSPLYTLLFNSVCFLDIIKFLCFATYGCCHPCLSIKTKRLYVTIVTHSDIGIVYKSTNIFQCFESPPRISSIPCTILKDQTISNQHNMVINKVATSQKNKDNNVNN